MGRSRYKIYEPTHPHLLTCTILNWLPIFTRKESVQIIIDSLKHLQKEENLKLYAYVILENHLHIIAQSDDIGKNKSRMAGDCQAQFCESLRRKFPLTSFDLRSTTNGLIFVL